MWTSPLTWYQQWWPWNKANYHCLLKTKKSEGSTAKCKIIWEERKRSIYLFLGVSAIVASPFFIRLLLGNQNMKANRTCSLVRGRSSIQRRIQYCEKWDQLIPYVKSSRTLANMKVAWCLVTDTIQWREVLETRPSRKIPIPKRYQSDIKVHLALKRILTTIQGHFLIFKFWELGKSRY